MQRPTCGQLAGGVGWKAVNRRATPQGPSAKAWRTAIVASSWERRLDWSIWTLLRRRNELKNLGTPSQRKDNGCAPWVTAGWYRKRWKVVLGQNGGFGHGAPHPRLHCGAQPWQSERLKTDDDMQIKVPCAFRFAQDAPGNFYAASDVMIGGWRARRVTVTPVHHTSMAIDETVGARFIELLQARSEEAVWVVARKLDLVVKDEAYPDGERLSQARLRTLLREVCAQLKSSKREWGQVAYVCTCFLFPRFGTCPHQIFARWLGKDVDVAMGSQVEFALGEGVQRAEDVEACMRRHATQRPCVAPGPARTTMDEIRIRAKQRKEKKEAAKTELKANVGKLFATPARTQKNTGKDDARLERLKKVFQQIQSHHFQAQFTAAMELERLGVTAKEAKALQGVNAVLLLHRKQTCPLPLRTLLVKIQKKWAAEIRDGSESGSELAGSTHGRDAASSAAKPVAPRTDADERIRDAVPGAPKQCGKRQMPRSVPGNGVAKRTNISSNST